jgi:uncharacterized protein (DUF1330 family)
MSAYLILDIDVTDQELYAQYVARARDIIENAGGRYLVRGGRVITLSGEWHPKRLVVIEFTSVEQAQRCLASPEYQTIAPLRERGAISRAIIVEGCAPPH